MKRLNDFITDNLDELKQFYDVIMLESGLKDKRAELEVPDQVKLNSLASIHEWVYHHREELEGKIEELEGEERGRELIERLGGVLEKLGEPAQQKDEHSRV